MPNPRSAKLNALLQRELAMLAEIHIKPNMGSALVTITGVEVAPNLREAMVYYSVYGQEADKRKAQTLLQKKRVALQSGLAAHVVIKYTPVLRFQLDETAERADRVEHILNDLGLARQPAEDEPESER